MQITLKQFLKENKISITRAAEELKISRPHLTMIVNGLPAGKKATTDIYAWSKGKICPLQTLYGKSCLKKDSCEIQHCFDYLQFALK